MSRFVVFNRGVRVRYCDVVAVEHGQAEASGHNGTQTLACWFVPGVPEPKRQCAEGQGRYSARRAMALLVGCLTGPVLFLARASSIFSSPDEGGLPL